MEMKLITLSNSGTHYALTENESILVKEHEDRPVDKKVLIYSSDFVMLHNQKYAEIGEFKFLMHFDDITRALRYLNINGGFVAAKVDDNTIQARIKSHDE